MQKGQKMSHSEHDKVLAFDTLFTNNHIQKLKIIMPFFDASKQKHIAVYIKYLELQYTMNYFKTNPFPPFPTGNTEDICKELKPYCSTGERQKMEQMEQMFANFKNYQEMMEMVTMMKEMFPEGEGGGLNPEMLSGLFGADTSQMFDMFSNLNNN